MDKLLKVHKSSSRAILFRHNKFQCHTGVQIAQAALSQASSNMKTDVRSFGEDWDLKINETITPCQEYFGMSVSFKIS